MNLPDKFLNRMSAELGEGYGAFKESYSRPAEKGVRVNTLKISVEDFKKISPLALGDKIPFEERAFYYSGEGAGRTAEHAAGLYYVQEPSAMSPVPRLRVEKGDRVLDLCAAPGGKATQIAAYLQGEGELVANEPDLKRSRILESNIERLGVRNCVVTCAKPRVLSTYFSSYFNKILVDAPCSGEGMFKKEENAVREWSEANVLSCAARQAEILGEAYKMLARGGRLVYSTCTFARCEDEGQIENFLSAHPDMRLLEMKKLYPHEIRGEGHFYAVLEKTDGETTEIKPAPYGVEKLAENLYRSWESEALKIKIPVLYQRGTCVYGHFTPLVVPPLSSPVYVRQAGVYLGRVSDDRKRFEPAHTLAMCLKEGEAESVDLDRETALAYLRGLTFGCGGKGYKLVTYSGYPLGWCKVSNGIAKNHLPKGLRI